MEAKALSTDTRELNSPDFSTPDDTTDPAPSMEPATATAGASAPGASSAVVTGRAFTDFGIPEPICAALAASDIVTAFPIQELTIPVALAGHDVIGQARTGTGKTFAFGVPVLTKLLDTSRAMPSAPRALVVVPTRELAIQVADDLRLAAGRTSLNVVTLYGGRAYEPQIEALATVDVVVGTPGRLLDLERQRHLALSAVDALVLDEADKMLDLGFLPDVEAILRLTPPGRQTMLFSATMPSEVVTLARRHLNQPMNIRAEHHDEPAHVPTTAQYVYRAHHLDKIEVLARVLQARGRGLTIVFSRTKRSCDQVASSLTERGFAVAAVHGDLGQSQRERAMRAFRNGKVDVLVATDVAARGLDVDDVTHVINNECPEDEKTYLHRIGRTGRAGRAGIAITFVDWKDMQRWKVIDDALNLGHPEPAETYSTSEHLLADLDIPADVTGSLPRSRRDRAGLEAEDLEDIGETGRSRSRQRQPDGRRGQRGSQRLASRPGADARGTDDGGPDEEGARQPRQRSRSRRRTRSGRPVASASSGDQQAAPPAANPGATQPAGSSGRPAGRRRRRPASGQVA